MKLDILKRIFVIISFILFISYLVHLHIVVFTRNALTSYPVEEMYHKQLITTIDSIFDARYDTNNIKENNYKANVLNKKHHFHSPTFIDIEE